jgi:hypothetical protein
MIAPGKTSESETRLFVSPKARFFSRFFCDQLLPTIITDAWQFASLFIRSHLKLILFLCHTPELDQILLLTAIHFFMVLRE